MGPSSVLLCFVLCTRSWLQHVGSSNFLWLRDLLICIMQTLSWSMWDLVPWLGPLHWEHGVLATEPPGKSHMGPSSTSPPSNCDLWKHLQWTLGEHSNTVTPWFPLAVFIQLQAQEKSQASFIHSFMYSFNSVYRDRPCPRCWESNSNRLNLTSYNLLEKRAMEDPWFTSTVKATYYYTFLLTLCSHFFKYLFLFLCLAIPGLHCGIRDLWLCYENS